MLVIFDERVAHTILLTIQSRKMLKVLKINNLPSTCFEECAKFDNSWTCFEGRHQRGNLLKLLRTWCTTYLITGLIHRHTHTHPDKHTHTQTHLRPYTHKKISLSLRPTFVHAFLIFWNLMISKFIAEHQSVVAPLWKVSIKKNAKNSKKIGPAI